MVVGWSERTDNGVDDNSSKAGAFLDVLDQLLVMVIIDSDQFYIELDIQNTELYFFFKYFLINFYKFLKFLK